MASALPTLFVLAVVVGAGGATWTFTPKGPNQTLIRSSVSLALVCCYMMWAVTYMAQLHPLIAPVRPAAEAPTPTSG